MSHMKTKVMSALLTFVMVFVTIFTILQTFFDNSIKIYIGYQSVTSQTWTALIVKNKNIFEEKLKRAFPNQKYKVVWSDEISGAVINTAMISGKCHFGFMGDMPCLLNMNKSIELEAFESALLCFTGKGEGGKNQSIVVPKDSNIKTVYDLKGKKVSVPIGSSAHYMLLSILDKYGITDDVEIVHQDIGLASQMLNTNKSDAFAIWAPYPNFLEELEQGRILVDGAESNKDYLAGVMVHKGWANENKEIVKLFIESLQEAQQFIKGNPNEAAEIFSKESGFDLKIAKKEVYSIEWVASTSESDLMSLEDKLKFLIDNKNIKNKFDITKFVYSFDEEV